ncbi:Fungal Zn(2)-Cys(6) binuclear cluster domain-containing protein [Penicillium ucsense]|uniref:Fungal Zn(2)-Cys(6) binuclear cluster domain-containing protein n=1 Tax=Penicillium ucsense TaxID=2839758 RepID=A0A8J8WI71_9EURO|nr:Fungal Zn(2)-Cys(6) binuclear cluster domain-containing protein [Penicillium ucsense]KAF7737721.1 Fungal Zn(2)-Cys(6) binuclear cluster domain-containing protein [Penicillium ucsense]
MPSTQSKPYSCVTCHRRKVKCDRQEPCSNCAKACADCIYQAPPPPRRRKREHDADVDAPVERGRSLRQIPKDTPLADGRERETVTPTNDATSSAEKSQAETGQMIAKEGGSVYLDTTLWTSLPDTTEVFGVVADDSGDDISQGGDEGYFLLSGHETCTKLAERHPSTLHIFKLWQTFLERVNPLTKLVHVPTVQQQILDAMGDLENTSNAVEALMFSIYCVALTSLWPEEVDKTFGEAKKSLLSKFRRGAQQAFRNAHFLRSSNTMVLQAFMLYLLSMRSFSDPGTIWMLSGIASRMAQKMGIHRDGSHHGLSIFETEMRRRIWFQLLVMEGTSAEFCGVAAAPFVDADTKPPMNVNDSDLDPRMTEPACEKEGPTEMVFVLARCEFGNWLRRWKSDAPSSGSPWSFLTSAKLSAVEKDRSIDELETVMERKFLRYCDQSIPLHSAVILMVRSACHYTRLLAHHPRHRRDPKTSLAEEEKDIVYRVCLKMIEYADYGQTNPDVRQFAWHMTNHMPWDAIIFVLSEMRHGNDFCAKERVWEIICNVYGRYVRHRQAASQIPLHRALQRLFLKSWRSYAKNCRENTYMPTACLSAIKDMADTWGDSPESKALREELRLDANIVLNEQAEAPRALSDREAGGFETLLGDSPLNWLEWEELLNQCPDSFMEDMTVMTGFV